MTASIARVTDFETTGLPEETDSRVCDVGFIDVVLTEPGFPVRPLSARSILVSPGVPMRPELSAVHHLIDEDFVDAKTIEDATVSLLDGIGEHDVYVAHKADFERHFFPIATGHRWICTYKCALRAWPDAPGHSNQVLRYWLESQGKIRVRRDLANPPHRAFPDAYATAHIFSALMQIGRPLERLIEITSMPAFLPTIRFGKHSGMKFSDVPKDYLQWLTSQSDIAKQDPDVMGTALYWLRKAA